MAVRTQHLQHLSPEGDPNSILIPQAYARRGLELAPNSALANLAMADTLAEDPRSLPYALRAAELDPTNADIWDELSEKYLKAGDFARYKDAIERSARIDPLGLSGTLTAVAINWDLGDRRKALEMVWPLYQHGTPRAYVRHIIRADLAFRSGDFSRARDEYAAAARNTEEGSRVWANGGVGSVYYAVGMFDQARPLIPFKALAADFELYTGKAPNQSAVEISRNHPFYAWNMSERNYFLLRGLVIQRRFADVAALYDRRFKSPEEFSRTPRGHMAFINDSIPVILALREVGRRREADRLYIIARNEAAKRYRASMVPNWYDFASAQLYAIGGDDRAALTALERAVRKGWLNRTSLALRDIADEPAFRSLANAPRFQAIRNRLESLYERERREIEASAPAAV
jgi:tetratricopeptide (TPR) repeat protein